MKLTKDIARQFATGEIGDLSRFTHFEQGAADELATGAAVERLSKEGIGLLLTVITRLSVDDARALARQRVDIALDGLMELNLEIATALSLHQGGDISLNGLVSIDDPAVASAIACHRGRLMLNGLGSLSTEVARALSENEVRLYLDGIKTLSEEAAEAIASHRGVLLSLLSLKLDQKAVLEIFRNRIEKRPQCTILGKTAIEALDELDRKKRTIDLNVAKKFLSEKNVQLDQYEEISDSAARLLAEQHTGELNLDGLKILSFESAKALSFHLGDDFTGENLSLNGLSEISDAQIARALACVKGELSLKGLLSLDDEIAGALSKHKGGELRFDGLTNLTEGAATALARHEGALSLNGLCTLDVKTAKALGKHQHPHRLTGLCELSDVAAESLGDPTLWVNGNHRALKTLNPGLAGILARHSTNDFLRLNGLENLIEKSAQALAFFEGNTLDLSGLRQLDVSVAEALSAAKTSLLVLDGIENLDETSARALAKFPSKISLSGLKVPKEEILRAFSGGSTNAGTLYLDGAKDISMSVARAEWLVKINRPISLGTVRSLKPDVARILAGHPQKLILNGINFLDVEAAKVLSNCNNGLCMNGLIETSDACLEYLAKVEGDLILNGIVSLGHKTRGALAIAIRRDFTYLLGLRYLTRRAFLLLKNNESRINFYGEKVLTVVPQTSFAPPKWRIRSAYRQKAEGASTEQAGSKRAAVDQDTKKEHHLEICRNVFEAMSKGRPGKCSATMIDWLTLNVDAKGNAVREDAKKGEDRFSCMNVFLHQLEIVSKQSLLRRFGRASDDDQQRFATELFNLFSHRMHETIENECTPKVAAIQDGKHLYHFLWAVAHNLMRDFLRKILREDKSQACEKLQDESEADSFADHDVHHDTDSKLDDKKSLKGRVKENVHYVTILNNLTDLGDIDYEALVGASEDFKLFELEDILQILANQALVSPKKDAASKVWAHYVKSLMDGEEIGQTELAKVFGINQSTVQRILVKKREEARLLIEQQSAK